MPAPAQPVDDDSDPGKYARLDRLAAEFAARYRRGERPTLEEYADRYPELAEEIRDLFPAMVGLEKAEEIRKDQSGDESPDRAPALSQVGDFRILREVGRGGMGVVYEAEQISLGRQVALKVLPAGPRRDGKALERFRHEARAAARLHHTNIVPVFEVGQEGDILYYTMQFIRGQGLDLVVEELKRLRGRGNQPVGEPGPPSGSGRASAPRAVPGARQRRGSLPNETRGMDAVPASSIAQSLLSGRIAIDAAEPTQPQVPERPVATTPEQSPARDRSGLAGRAVDSAAMPGGAQISTIESSGSGQPFFRSVAQIGRQAAEALAYAHARGVLHRDVKPSNLLLDTSGVVWITDFGLAKSDESGLTATGDLLGTLRYIAPERLRGEGDARADVYALGLTLYELATLRPAFDSADRLRLIDQIKNQEPVRPRAIDPRISRDLETLLLKAIEKDPRRRYQAAADMAEDLRRFLDGEPIRARKVGELERVWKWAMRRKAIAGLLLFAVVSLIGGMAASLSFSLQASHYAALADARARDAAASAAEAARVAADARAASAQATAEAGEIERGVYGLIEALQIAPNLTTADRARRRAIERNIEAWTAAQPVLRHTIGGLTRETRILFTGPDRTVVSLVTGRRLRRFDLATGRPVGDPGGVEFPAPILATPADGSLVVTVAEIHGRPGPAWDVRVFDADSGRQRAQLPPLEYERVEADVISDQGGRYLGLKLAIAFRNGYEGTFIRRTWRLDSAEPAGPPGDIRERWWSFDARMIDVRGGHTVLVYHDDGALRGAQPDDRLLFWDLDDGRPVARLEPDHSASVVRIGVEATGAYTVIAFDGTRLVCASGNGQVRWWDVVTGRPARPDWMPHRATSEKALAGDGRTLAVRCEDNRVRFYDLATGSECGASPLLRGGRVSICPQGSFLLARRGDELAVWQVPVAPRLAHPSAIEARGTGYNAMAAPGDGEEYAVGKAHADGSAMGRDTFAKLIKVTTVGPITGAAHRFATTDGRPRGVPFYPTVDHPCYSPNGRLFAACRTQARKAGVGQPAIVAVWDLATGRAVLPWTALRDYIHCLAFSPDGETLAVGVVPGIWLVDVASRRPPRFLTQPGPIARLQFSPDGRRLAAAARSGWGPEHGVRLWDVATDTPVGPALPTGALPFIAFAPGGGGLLVLDTVSRRLVRLDPEGGRPIAQAVALPGLDAEVTEADRPQLSPLSLAVAFRPDGAAFVESPTTTSARQYDVNSGRPIGPAMNHGDLIGWLAYSPDGATLASACPDGTVRLWDAPTGAALGPALVHGLPVLGVYFSADGTRLSVMTVDGRARSWPVPRVPAVNDPGQLRLRAEVISGLRWADGDEVLDLSLEAWGRARDRLRQTWPEAIPGADGRKPLWHWHRDRADDARRIGDDDAHRHHLEQLADLDPGDWLPVAERVASLAEAGRFGAAAAGYARVAKLAQPDDLSSWLWYCGVKDLAAGRSATALWHLDRVALARPDDWRVHAHRADALERMGRRADAAAEQDLATALGADPTYIAEAAGDRAALGDWAAAWRLTTLAAAQGAGDRAERALICLRQGDRDGYRRACAAILSAISAGPVRRDTAIEAAWVVGLSPDAVRDYARPLELAGSALASAAALKGRDDEVRDVQHQAHQARAAVLLRAGRTDEALAGLAKAAALVDYDPSNDLLAAIAHALSGQLAEGRARLEKARATLATESGKPRFWQRAAELDVLITEAESALLDRAFPAAPFAAPH